MTLESLSTKAGALVEALETYHEWAAAYQNLKVGALHSEAPLGHSLWARAALEALDVENDLRDRGIGPAALRDGVVIPLDNLNLSALLGWLVAMRGGDEGRLCAPIDSGPWEDGVKLPAEEVLTRLQRLRVIVRGLKTVSSSAPRQTTEPTGEAPKATTEPPKNLTDTQQAICRQCKRKAWKGEVIARKLNLSYDYIRRELAKLVKGGHLRKTDEGYRTTM